MAIDNEITFKISNGANARILPLDPNPKTGTGVRYDFTITHPDGSKESFVYTPVSSESEEDKSTPNNGSLSQTEHEALSIFQANYQ